MMSFSTMDFLTLEDVAESGMDSAMGGRLAYQLLKTMPFVDAQNMGVTGHSMGTWAAWSVAETFKDNKAIVLQCGQLYPDEYYDSENLKFNNVLLLQAKIEEFTAFCDYTHSTKGLMETELRYSDFAGQAGPISWNTTYGDFDEGTARRIQLLNTNHRLVSVSKKGIATTMEWFADAFGMEASISPTDQTAVYKELLTLIGMLAALVSMLPLLAMLTKTKFFAAAAQEVPERPETQLPTKKWWKTALVAILISAVTYPFITQLGHGLVPLPESVFKMTVGNGVITWFFFLAVIAFSCFGIGIRMVQAKDGGDIVRPGACRRKRPEEAPLGSDRQICSISAHINCDSVYLRLDFQRSVRLGFPVCMASASPVQRRQMVAVPYIPSVLSVVLCDKRRREALRTDAPEAS